jgi:hypothetical protein
LTLEKTGQAASPQSCIIRAAINAIVMAGWWVLKSYLASLCRTKMDPFCSISRMASTSLAKTAGSRCHKAHRPTGQDRLLFSLRACQGAHILWPTKRIGVLELSRSVWTWCGHRGKWSGAPTVLNDHGPEKFMMIGIPGPQ